MNKVEEAQVHVGHPYPEQLGQGPFIMADVWCKCGKQVGYKFVEDCTSSQRNQHHIGRFGLVNSCVRLSSFDDASTDKDSGDGSSSESSSEASSSSSDEDEMELESEEGRL
jgi:hypothetical protein